MISVHNVLARRDPGARLIRVLFSQQPGLAFYTTEERLGINEETQYTMHPNEVYNQIMRALDLFGQLRCEGHC